MEVTLQQMLDARERRAWRQMELSRTWGLPLVSYTMNIPGPIKTSPIINRGFTAGRKALEHRLPQRAVAAQEVIHSETGWEALYVVDMPPLELKKITTALEDSHPLGRLFDMDVLDGALNKLDRESVGGGSRNCLICGAPGKACASRRAHSVEQLQERTQTLLKDYFRGKDAEQIGIWAAQSLLEEVCATPKPGLVDRNNRGSHRDMDVFTFMASAAALEPYLIRCARIGQDTVSLTPSETFARLRQAGLEAEEQMYAATGGVNTHKGAVFTMGILCGAAGRLWDPTEPLPEEKLFQTVAEMTREAMAADFETGRQDTAGQRLYRQRGIRGIRGQVAQGLPAVSQVGLPVYREALARGMDKNDAGVLTLLHLIDQVEDTNLLTRGGPQGAEDARQKVRELLASRPLPDRSLVEDLDRWFIARNLSPGGCADLLAAVYFTDRLLNHRKRGDRSE